MIIEIRKVGFVNKGAELMLYAIMERLRDRYPDAIITMAPTHSRGNQPFSKIAQWGFYPKAWLWKFGIQWGDFAKLLPLKLREMYGLVLDKEVDVILDASGFSYSDQWGAASSRELARSSKRWSKRGAKVILLPQALGPYNGSEIQHFVKTWVNHSDLIFARESDSLNYLTSLVGVQQKIKMCPDFTNLIKGTLPADYNAADKRVAIIPNYRMIDKTSMNESEAYIPFMIHCAKYLVKKKAKPFVLVHEGENDRILAEKISEAAGGIPIVTENDPLHIKGIIGTCDATIGSRFHGLVSALSQGVPSLATGWSHKYIRLFEDYNFKDGVVTVLDNELDVQKKIDLLLEPESAKELRKNLMEKSDSLKERSEEMWNMVFEKIDEAAKK